MYWHRLQAVSKKMVRQGRKGKITLVSSTLGFMSIIGYASYSPAKHALRGKLLQAQVRKIIA